MCGRIHASHTHGRTRMHAPTPMSNLLRPPAKYKYAGCIVHTHVHTYIHIHICTFTYIHPAIVVECTEWHINDASKPRAGPRSPENTAAPRSPRLSLYLSCLRYFSLALSRIPFLFRRSKFQWLRMHRYRLIHETRSCDSVLRRALSLHDAIFLEV